MAVTICGVVAVTFMMVMYALESRSRHFIAAFALGYALSSSYEFLARTWLFWAGRVCLDLRRPPPLPLDPATGPHATDTLRWLAPSTMWATEPIRNGRSLERGRQHYDAGGSHDIDEGTDRARQVG